MFLERQKVDEINLGTKWWYNVGTNNFDLLQARITFKNIPIYKLQSFSFKDVAVASESFKKIPGVSETLIIQTASRVEIFTVIGHETGESPDARRAEGKGLVLNKIKETWESLTELDSYDLDHFDQTIEVYRNDDVYRNLLRLASGLDSFVVGKSETLDEIKKAISFAKEAENSGKILNKLFDTCIRVATRIRESTGISKDVTSFGDIAVKLIDEKAGLDNKKILLIGTGDSAATVAKSLSKRSIKFDVTSMTIERSTGFSNLLGGTPVTFEDVLAGFDKFDIIIVATTADYFVISHGKIKRVMENKKKGTLLLDISNPRAVDEKVANFPGMKLVFRDQLAEIYDENIQILNKKIPTVEKMVDKESPIIATAMSTT